MKLLSKTLLTIVFLLVCVLGTAAETPKNTPVKMRTVQGLVTDATNGQPLIGVRIKAYDNPAFSAMSDEKGSFSISVPDYQNTLTADADGYSFLLVPVNTKTNSVAIRMYSDDFTPFYESKLTAEKQKTATIGSMNADFSVDRQIQTLLGGDVRTVFRSGQQGIGAMFLMNGINSLNGNAQPLVVLDGVPLDMQYNRNSIHDGFYNNILSNISVSDIESVKVLKNGTALYGAKGANCVLLINTKRNKSMATKIDVDITGSFEQVPHLPEMMNSEDYRFYASELLGTTGTKLTDFKFLKSDKNYYYYKQFHNSTDWSKQVYRDAFSQNYGINVQGGDDVASYNLSVGYGKANSTLKDFDMSRFNLRLNSDINLSRNLDVRFDASYSDINRDLRDDGVADDLSNTTITSVGLLGLIKSPFLSPYQYDLNGNISSFLSDADDYLNEAIGSKVSLANPASLLYYGEGKNKNVFGNRMINLAITPVYKLNRRLTLQEHFSFNLVNTNANYYTPMRGMPSLIIENVGTVENVAKAMASHSNTFLSDTRLNWAKKTGAHNLHTSAGVRLYSNSYSMSMLKGYNTNNDKTPNISTSLSYKTSGGLDDKSLSTTYYALGDYNYKGRYFLSGGTSMEASSLFGSDADGLKLFGVSWGLFPSVQGAWLVTSEPWLTPNKWLNYLKVNAGFDISGNDDIDSRAARSYFGATRLGGAIDGLVLENIGNTHLKWETTRRFTTGLDMNLIDNRLSVAANYFSSKTDNLLSMHTLGYVGGLSKIWGNEGSLSNTGFDFSVNLKVLDSKNLKAEVGASAGHYRNKITALPSGQSEIPTDVYGATILSRVGSPVGVFYGYKTNGVYATASEAASEGKYLIENNGDKKYFGAGDMNFVSADAVVNENDRTIIGNPNPDLYGTLFGNIRMKNITLSAVFNYSLGNDVFNYQRMILEGGNCFYNQTTAMNRRWTAEGQHTDIPVITYDDPMGNSRFSDRWIEDGSYLRLRTVSVSYALPIHNTYLQGLTIWGAANNLWTLTKYLGGDPESSASNSVLLQGIDRGLLPQSRTFALGLKINI